MATPDYDPDSIITPPPGKGGGINDLTGDPINTSGGGSSGGSTSVPTPSGTDTYGSTYQNTPYSPPTQGGGALPELDLGNIPAPYVPRDVPIPYVPDFDLKEVPYKPPPLPSMPEVDKTLTPAPEKDLEPMQDLIPGGDTQSINEDWEAIAAKAPGVTPEQTVQGQLQQLFAEGSPLLEYARGIGLQYANSRGLINSDIAAESGAMALFNQAVPIATSDAQIFARRAEMEAAFWQNAGLQAQAANFQSRLQAQAHVEAMREMALQGDINARLQLQQFGYNWDLNEQQNIHRLELAAFEGKVQARLNLQQLGLDVERLRVDWGYRVQANDQELRNALIMSKFEDDQLVQRITQDHMNTLREIGYSGYQDRMRDYYNNEAARRRQAEADRQAWLRQQDDQEWRSGENAADRQFESDQRARDRQEADRQRQWEADQRERDRQQRDDEQDRQNRVNWQVQYANAVDNLGVNLTNEIMNIMNNPNMTPQQQENAARRAWDRYVTRFNNTTEFYRSSPLWDPSWQMRPMSFGDVYTAPPPAPTTEPPVHTLPPPGSGGGGGSGDWDYTGGTAGGGDAGQNYTPPKRVTPTYVPPSTTYPIATQQQAPSAGDSLSFMEPSAPLFNANTLDNPLYSRNSLTRNSLFNFR